jgi:hypothetical protein
MRFEWDDEKSGSNVRKHGIDFTDVPQIFSGPMLVDLDDREDYGEDRWFGIGWLRDILTVVVWTEPKENSVRIISARKANEYERKRYEKSFQH